jgi:hypothetical protein
MIGFYQNAIAIRIFLQKIGNNLRYDFSKIKKSLRKDGEGLSQALIIGENRGVYSQLFMPYSSFFRVSPMI